MILLLAALGCGDPETVDTAPEVAPLVPLEDALFLRRLSLDLRGVNPTPDELAALRSGEATVDSLRDGFLDDPRLEERLVSMLAERWHTRLEEFQIPYYDYGLDEGQEFSYERAVGEEPLRLIAHVVIEDLPWTEIVTADYTIADDLLRSVWPLEAVEAGASGWALSRYTDGRPAAGVLATNGLWWRYTTNTSNLNRSRAAAISKLLLCQDMLSRPVSFADGISLGDDDATTEAIRSEPSCVACHASIEPLAAALFGFQWMIQYSDIEMTYYHPEREALAETYLQTEPAWFGEPISGLAGLGDAVADDERFYRCAAETAAELLWRRPPDPAAEFDQLESLRQTFLLSDARMKPLLKAVTDTESYRAGAVDPGADPELIARERPSRMLSPDQLASAVEDLTGYRWTWAGYDQLQNDTYGYRILTGGVDGEMISSIQSEPGLTWALVIKRLAQAAALHVALDDLSGDAPRLLTEIASGDRPGDPAFTEQLEALHLRAFSTEADPAWIARIEALWEAVDAEDGEGAAWAAVIEVTLRDARFVMY